MTVIVIQYICHRLCNAVRYEPFASECPSLSAVKYYNVQPGSRRLWFTPMRAMCRQLISLFYSACLNVKRAVAQPTNCACNAASKIQREYSSVVGQFRTGHRITTGLKERWEHCPDDFCDSRHIFARIDTDLAM
jgi:hypothetical protein